nr:hypothetical protein [Candidatus Sigynarchaeota archaeon]
MVIASLVLSPVAGTYVMYNGKLSLSLANTDPFTVGAVQTMRDAYNIQATSNKTARFNVLSSTCSEPLTNNVTSADNYPASLGTISGLNPWNPSTYTEWIATYNNSRNWGTYDITFEQMRETLGDGEKKTITVNNTLTVLNIELNLAGDTPYLLLVTNLIGTMNTRLSGGTITALDPAGNPFYISTQRNLLGAPVYYYVIVTKVSGVHLLSIVLGGAVANTVAQFELRGIPIAGVSPGNMQMFGDDPFGSNDQWRSKVFNYRAFSIDVGPGDIYAYYLNQAAVGSDLFVAIPGALGYSVVNSGAVATVGRTSNMAIASGRVMIIAVEYSWMQLVTYRVLFEQQAAQGLSIPQSLNVTIDPYSYKSISINVPTTMLLRTKVTQPPTNPGGVAITNLYIKVRNSFLTSLDANYYVSVINGTEIADRIYFLTPGDYFMRLDNPTGTEPAILTIETQEYANPVTEGFIVPWEDTYNATGNNLWPGFNVSSDYQTATFVDLSKGTGAKIPRVFKISINETSFVQFKFEVRYNTNPAFNTPDAWTGDVDLNFLGPDGYYTEYPAIRNWLTINSASFTVTANTNPGVSNSGNVTLFPGDYYLMVGMDNWADTTPNPDEIYNDSIVLSLAMVKYNNHFKFVDAPITSHPVFHSYLTQAGTFRSVKYLDLAVNYNDATDYTTRITALNGRQYNFGVIFRVTGATALNWTQLIAFFNNAFDLSASTTNMPAEAYATGISIIYEPGFWSPSSTKYYNQQIGWQNGAGTGGYLGQTIDAGITGQYAMEFGVFASSFWLWINPDETGTLAQDINQTLCIELAQYNTPKLSTSATLAGGLPIDWNMVMIIGIGAAIVIGVIVVVAVVRKKSPLGLKYAFRKTKI